MVEVMEEVGGGGWERREVMVEIEEVSDGGGKRREAMVGFWVWENV